MKLFASFSIVLIAAASYVFAEQAVDNAQGKIVQYGPTSITNQSVQDLTIHGPATINDSKVAKANIKGPLQAKKSSFEKIHVDGIANFDYAKVKEIVINGPLFASNSALDAIFIATDQMALSNSKVNKLVVKTHETTSQEPTIFLENGTKVESIKFSGKKGKVILGGGSAVSNVDNGEIQNRK